jgi:penicillin-binding protein 1C
VGRLLPLTRRAVVAAVGSTVGAAIALLISFYAVPLPERLSAAPSPVVRWRDGTPAHIFLAPDDRTRMAVRLTDVDPAYVRALFELEDRRFTTHVGVDPIALMRAAIGNLTGAGPRSGASTLTMQLVRVVEPRPRTYLSKGVEVWRAMQLETRLSKDQILSAYLTFTPYGRNVEGVEAASWAYFGHGSAHLAADEIAVLLAVPQAPNARYPAAANVSRLRAARDRIAAYLVSRDALPRGEGAAAVSGSALLDTVRGRPVPTRLRPFPREIAEVARWVRAEHPDVSDLTTTLDSGLHRTILRHVSRGRSTREERGIRHIAVVVVEHRTHEVVSLIGSLDPDGEGLGDQVPMFDVPRSPGSALKPFIFALGVDYGRALPDHLVLDIPAAYQGYAPRNFEDGYDGLVRLDHALSRSLNLPFVFLLEEVGVERFVDTLRRGGATSLHPDPSWYGLSAAVGGIELTPLEVTTLYASLASDGRSRPLSLDDGGASFTDGPELFSEGAAWLTRRALRLRDRPDFPARRDHAAVPSGIHWKTGTSFGHRDAWACGSGPTHTACIWMGNADMASSRWLVGAEAAGDLLFDVLESAGTRQAWVDPRPAGLIEIEVDAWSGYLPTGATPSTKRVWALAHRVPTRTDPFHVRMEVDVHTGEAVRPGCREGRTTEERTFVLFPASVRRWLTDGHRRLPEVPRYAPGCVPPGGQPPRILSPSPGEVRALIPGMAPTDQEVALIAESASGRTVSWFVDGQFLGEVGVEERMWWTPSVGEHVIVARDDAGRESQTTLTVRRLMPR